MINLSIPSFNQPPLKSINNPNPLLAPIDKYLLGLHPGHFLTAFPSIITFDFDRLVCPQAPLSFAYLFNKTPFEDTEYFSATSVVLYVLLFFIKALTIPFLAFIRRIVLRLPECNRLARIRSTLIPGVW